MASVKTSLVFVTGDDVSQPLVNIIFVLVISVMIFTGSIILIMREAVKSFKRS
jgi:hypothetical protein